MKCKAMRIKRAYKNQKSPSYAYAASAPYITGNKNRPSLLCQNSFYIVFVNIASLAWLRSLFRSLADPGPPGTD